MSEKIFIAQPYQEGTSFSDITKAVESNITKEKRGIEIIKFPYTEEIKREGLLDNSEELILHHEVIRTLLEKDFSHALLIVFCALQYIKRHIQKIILPANSVSPLQVQDNTTL